MREQTVVMESKVFRLSDDYASKLLSTIKLHFIDTNKTAVTLYIANSGQYVIAFRISFKFKCAFV
jgi:hypothetical protein